MDIAQLALAATATPANAIKYADHIVETWARFQIETQRERAMFIAQTAIESGHFNTIEEGLYYKDAQWLANTFKSLFGGNAEKARPYTRNPKGLGQLRYGGYWGRGLIQISLEENYRALSDYLGIDYVSNPDWLLRPRDAAMSAGWYFAVFRDCRPAANKGDVTACTRLINGKALMHLAERQAQYHIALGVAL